MLKGISIVSKPCSMCLPKNGKETEQRLTISDRGEIKFSSKIFNSDSFKSVSGRKTEKNIESEYAKEILNDIFNYFDNKPHFYVLDGGNFVLTMLFDDGKKKIIDEPLFCQNDKMFEMCNKIRDIIGIDDLLLFDGIYDDFEFEDEE